MQISVPETNNVYMHTEKNTNRTSQGSLNKEIVSYFQSFLISKFSKRKLTPSKRLESETDSFKTLRK